MVMGPAMRFTEEKTTLDKPTFYLDKSSEDFFPLEVLNVKWDSNKAITLDKFFFPRVECSARSMHYHISLFGNLRRLKNLPIVCGTMSVVWHCAQTQHMG